MDLLTIWFQYQSGRVGKSMMTGTYESESAVYSHVPQNVPRPIACDHYQDDENMWFYLAEYHDMVDEIPNPHHFVSVVARLHRESMGKSPNGQFGFHVPTHMANIAILNGVDQSWESWYTKAMTSIFQIEQKLHDEYDEEFEKLKDGTLKKVIPRLLRPLETNGRRVVPCLIHGDLWPGNTMPDAVTEEIMIFDSAAFWGHHEADLGSWRAPRYRMGRPFMKEYQKRVGMDFPEDDWDDRNALYAM